MPELR